MVGTTSTIAEDEAGARVVLFTTSEPAIPDDARLLLLDAQTEQTFEGLKAALQSADLLVIDSSAFENLPIGFLQQRVNAGEPILGLNITLADLSDRAGNPVVRTTFPARPNEPFYSFLFKTNVAGVIQSADGQPNFSDGLFKGNLRQLRLEAKGLTFIADDSGGRVVPLTALNTPSATQR